MSEIEQALETRIDTILSGSCGYTKDESEVEEFWMTDCGDGFYTNKGEYNYCPHCGKKTNYR